MEKSVNLSQKLIFVPNIEFFKTLVNSWKLLTNDTKSSTLDGAGILEMPLKMYFIIGIY